MIKIFDLITFIDIKRRWQAGDNFSEKFREIRVLLFGFPKQLFANRSHPRQFFARRPNSEFFVHYSRYLLYLKSDQKE